MTINKNLSGDKLTIELIGRFDTVTAPDFEDVINNELDGVNELVLDFKGLEYISSAGLRGLLKAHKIMSKRGGMTIINVCELVMTVFEISSFSEILNIKA